jgi:hypothetical protein
MAGIRDPPAYLGKTLRVGLSSHRPRGRFLDCFCLDDDVTLALADGSSIYVTEKDKDENIVIKKYKIVSGARN